MKKYVLLFRKNSGAWWTLGLELVGASLHKSVDVGLWDRSSLQLLSRTLTDCFKLWPQTNITVQLPVYLKCLSTLSELTMFNPGLGMIFQWWLCHNLLLVTWLDGHPLSVYFISPIGTGPRNPDCSKQTCAYYTLRYNWTYERRPGRARFCSPLQCWRGRMVWFGGASLVLPHAFAADMGQL